MDGDVENKETNTETASTEAAKNENTNAATTDNSKTEMPKDFKTLITKGWLSHVLIAAGLLLIVFLTMQLSKRWVKSEAENLTDVYSPVERDINGEPQKDDQLNLKVKGIDKFTCPAVAEASKIESIKNQKRDALLYAENHREAAISFYSYFYASYIVFSVFGLLSLISLAIIAKKGYLTADPHLITIFLISMGIVLMYQGFFNVFQQKINMEYNAKLFGGYSKLATNIDTYCATGKIPVVDPTSLFESQIKLNTANTNTAQTEKTNTNTTGNNSAKKEETTKPNIFYVKLDTDDFINYAGWQLGELKKISIAYDESKVAIANEGKPLAF